MCNICMILSIGQNIRTLAFLRGYYQLDPGDADEIVGVLNDRKELRLYDYNTMAAGEYFDDFITSEDVYDRFEKLIMMNV